MKRLFLLGCLVFSGGILSAEAQQLRLTLEEAVEMALSENPTIRIAELEIERYDYVKRETWGNLLPQLSVDGTYQYSLVKQEMAKGLSFGADNTLAATANLSLAVLAPSVYRTLKMNKAQLAAAVESARSSRIDLVAAVKAGYYNVLLAEESLRVLREAQATAQQTVDDTQLKYDNGLASEYDLLTAQVQLSNLRPSILQAESSIEVTKLLMKMYLSVPSEVDLELDGSLGDFRDEVLNGSDALSTDISDNTSLRSLDLQSEVLTQQYKAIQASRWPTIAFFGSATYTGNDMERPDFSSMMGGGTGSAPSATKVKNEFWWQHPISLGLQISIPIFSGLTKQNQVKQIKNNIAQLQLQRSYAEQQMDVQVRQQINTLLTARETMFAQEVTMRQAQKAYDISATRYGAGAGTILELNSAQLSLTQAQLNYSQSIYDYLTAKADYDKIIGKEE